MYNLKDVESLYTVNVISGESITARNSFTKYINVPFTPDYVVFKNINVIPVVEIANEIDGSYVSGDVYQSSYAISTNLLPMSPTIAILDCVVSSTSLNYNETRILKHAHCKLLDSTSYKIYSPVVGDFTFNIKNGSGDPVNFFGSVSIQLEFVKLK